MKLLSLFLFPVMLIPICESGAQEASHPSAPPLYAIDPQTPQELRDLFHFSQQVLPLVSAHRGGPRAGFPENCISTFEHTLAHTFAMLEVDPRMTSDGAIVTLHDATLDRTTTGVGLVADKTLTELKKLRLKDTQGSPTQYQIPTLDEVIQWARHKTILVLDQKDVSLEARIKKVEQHQAEAFVILIVGNLQDIKTCYSLNKNIMMEVFLGDRQKFEAFDQSGVPWSNIIAFVGHTPPEDKELLRMIHDKGASCIVGTSRNLDRQLVARDQSESASFEPSYRRLLNFGADLIETDLPLQVGQLLYGSNPAQHVDSLGSKAKYFTLPSRLP